TAVAHSLFNVSGALLFIWFVKPYAALIQYISPSGAEIDIISRQIANAHTIFNITMTLIWIPLLNVMVKLVMKLIPEGKLEKEDPAKPVYLDKNVLSQPAAALNLVAKETLHCGEIVRKMLSDVLGTVRNSDTQTLNTVREYGQAMNSLQNEINEYLADLFSNGVLTEQQATQTAKLMYVLSDVERMGNLSVEMADTIQEKLDKGYSYSQEAMDDLENSLKQIEKMYKNAMSALMGENESALKKIIKHKDEVLDLDIKMRKSHMQRVTEGKCQKSLTAPFTKILQCIDRMGNSCVNLAEVAMNQMNFEYFIGEEKKDNLDLR
ncbi:MAG: Na/Pi cotransporter family protein, partial [Lachnospiraceae bacterium]|nr:Na/Pi cotransporter family protein [Lachnospiraceae bacterium]